MNAKIHFDCPIHGEQTVVESNHMKGFGCKKCCIKGAPKLTNDEFLKRIEELNNGIEILEEYKGYHKPILFKNKYGLCKLQPGNLLKGCTGSLKVAVDKTVYMIEQLKEKHNEKYTYPNFQYCGNRCLAKINCKEHGEFEQLVDVHLIG